MLLMYESVWMVVVDCCGVPVVFVVAVVDYMSFHSFVLCLL